VSGLAFMLLGAAALRAQSSTGGLSGRVSDAATGRSLQGAVVRVAGTGLVDYTDQDGRYTLNGVAAGSHQVVVEYVGLDASTQTIVVAAGRVEAVSFSLEKAEVELAEFTVTGQAQGQARAINQQKTASGIVNIVSEETFGPMLDGNIGQALQRLPGVSVDEDQDGSQGSINIRGISGAYNSVQIDGNRVPSSGGSRSFNPRQLAADGVTNIEVIKAATPDRDGDAIGGIVNLVSRSAFQRDGRAMNLKVSGVLNEEPGNWGYAASLNYSDIFSIGTGEKNLGVSLSLSSYETDRYSINADQDWIRVDPETNPELDLSGYPPPVWFMEATHWEHDTRTTNTTTLSSSIDFRTSENDSFYFRPMFSHFDRNGVKYETDVDIDTRFQNQAGGRKTYAELTPTYGLGTAGDDGSRSSRGWIGTNDDLDNDLYALNFGGRHEREATLLTYDLYYSKNKQQLLDGSELNMLMEPDEPWFVHEYEIDDADGFIRVNVVNGVDPTDLSLMTEGELIEETSVKTEETTSGRLDWQRSFVFDRGTFTLKTGGKYHSSRMEFDQTVDVYSMDDAFPYADVLTPTSEVILLKPKYYDVHPRVGQELLRTNPGLFELEEEDTLEDSNFEDYRAKQTTSAAYIMGTYQTGPHTVVAGVRFENSKWDNTNKVVSYLDGESSVTEVKTSNSYDFWLPGLHLRHELRDNLILRESYNRSYGRPPLGELSSGRFINEDGDIADGNPNLDPAVSDNFDIQLEYYTQHGGLYSIGVFYKDVKDFAYTQVYDFSELDANGIPIPAEDGDFEYERPVNGTDASNLGVELIARQRLYFLPGALRGLAVSFSATFTESEAAYPNRDDRDDLPLEGFSDFLATASLEYAWKGLSARLDYRTRSEYVEGLGDSIETDEFFASEYRLDAEIGYRLRDGLTLFGSVTNLTDRGQISFSGYRRFVEDASYAGRKWTFGAEYAF